MKKFMIDSNVIIEFMKNSPEAVSIIKFIRQSDYKCYITIDSIEEILYILLKHFSKKSYWDLKNNKDLTRITYQTIIPLIKTIIKSTFKTTFPTEKTQEIFFDVCEKYGLLPKDALLLSICIEHNIDTLITLNKDFKNLKIEENIKIIQSIKELENH